jgi:uncharacterized membrane protein YkvA (DUF1232 family)
MPWRIARRGLQGFALYAFAQAVFALTYAHKKIDVIPDLIPNVGRADDSSVVRAVLIQKREGLRQIRRVARIQLSKITSQP